MIKILKKPLYKLKDKTSFILIAVTYLITSIFIFVINGPKLDKLFITNIISIYVAAFLIIYLLYYRYAQKIREVAFDIEALQEKMNLLDDDLEKKSVLKNSIKYKIRRYELLEGITKKLASCLYLEDVSLILVDATHYLIGQNKGNCFLYINEPKLAKLQLRKSKKERKGSFIEAKEGDIFDKWVIRHTSPLLIEDASTDFRFDLEMVSSQESRHIGSLVAAPMFREDKFIGILRIDNIDKHIFDLDDLRVLSILADLGAISIENALIYEHTQELAIKDDLTELYLKRYIQNRLKEEFDKAVKFSKCMSILMLDIDNFKSYNDKYGHMAGDIVLKNIALWLKETLQDYGAIIGRFGGEEFIVILPNITKSKARKASEDLRERIAYQRIVLRRKETRITVSLGLATFPDDNVSNEEGLLRLADEALYKAKQQGKNRLCFL